MPSFQDDIMREFDQGVHDIESEKALKKPIPPVAEGQESLADIFDTGVKEIEQVGVKEAPTFVSRVEKALKTLPLTIDPLAMVRKEEAPEKREPILPERIGALGISKATLPAARRPPLEILPPKKIDPMEAAKKGIAAGVVGLAESVGTGLEYAGVRTGIKLLKRVGKETEKYWKGKAKPFETPAELQGSILNDPGIMLKGSWWTYNLANMTPSFAAMMIPGVGAAKYLKVAGKALELTPKVIERLVKFGSMTAAGITAGGMEGASTYQEILNRGGSEQDAASGMEAMTLAAGALNSIGFGKITGALGNKKASAVMRFLKTGSWEGLTEYLEEPVEVLIKMGILPEAAFTKKEAIEQLKEGVNVIPIAGVMGGGTSMIFAEPSDKTEKLKKTVLDGITKTYKEGTQNADQTVGSIVRGYKNQLFDNHDLDGLLKKYPELKNRINAAREIVKTDVIKDTLTAAIDEGVTTGVLRGQVFRDADAVDFIHKGLTGNIFTPEDIEEFKEKYPALRSGLNNLIAEKVTTDIDIDLEFDKFEFEPITKPVAEMPGYAIQDIENIYLKAKERARKEPISLHEIQERFKERQGREASAKEQEELKRIYEKAKRRSQKRKIFEERKREKDILPKTKEELELEAYEPALPAGAKEVRVKEGERTYPRGAVFVAGKPAPEELKVEYKAVLKKVGKKESPWLTLSGARNAIESDKMKAMNISPATHKVVATKGGYQIVPIKAGGPALAREVKKEVKGKTLLSWVRAMGGVKDLTLPGEIRALAAKETGIVGLTTLAPAKGLPFDEMAQAAVENGWLPENLEDPVGTFAELLRNDIFAQKEKGPRAERLADVAERTEREERWKEFDRAEDDMLKYFAEHPNEEFLTDLDQWQKESIADIRIHDAKRAKEIEEDTRREVEEENTDLEGLKEDEGFSEFIEAWDEKEILDEETTAELEAWRAEQKDELEVPEAVSHIELVKRYVKETGKKVEEGKLHKVKERYSKEWARIEEADAYKKELWDKLPESFRRNRGINEYTTKELEGMAKEVKPEVREPEAPKLIETKYRKRLEELKAEALLSSKKKAGVNYEMEVMVAETGETVTVTKDAAVALRETKEELNKYEKFLECII